MIAPPEVAGELDGDKGDASSKEAEDEESGDLRGEVAIVENSLSLAKHSNRGGEPNICGMALSRVKANPHRARLDSPLTPVSTTLHAFSSSRP